MRPPAGSSCNNAMNTLKQIIVHAPPVLRQALYDLTDHGLLTPCAGLRPGPLDTPTASAKHPVRLELVVRPPLGAGPSPGSGRSNGHCSARHGPPCVRRRRSTACGPSTTRRCVPRWRRPDATQRCLDPGFSERIGNSRRTGVESGDSPPGTASNSARVSPTAPQS